jgi:hypothetical protein
MVHVCVGRFTLRLGVRVYCSENVSRGHDLAKIGPLIRRTGKQDRKEGIIKRG